MATDNPAQLKSVESEPRKQQEPLWTVADAANFLRKTVSAIYKMVERRQIPFVRLRGRFRFNPPTIRDWIERNSIPPDKAGDTH